jgi:hypothetical protein
MSRKAAAVICLTLAPVQLSAQTSDRGALRLEIKEACSDCALLVTGELRIGGPSQDVDAYSVVATAPDGRLFIQDNSSSTFLQSFDSDGRSLPDIGRRGRGPGEFEFARHVTIANDSIYVHDAVLGRISIFDLDGRFARSVLIPAHVAEFLVTPSGDFIASGFYGRAEAIGAPYHIFDPRGTWIGSFPEPGGRYQLTERPLLSRSIRSGPGETFWGAKVNEYVIEQWDTTGRLLTSVERNVSWFIPSDKPHALLPGRRPPGIVRDIHIDDQDRLWVLILVADERWERQFHPDRPAEVAFTWNLDAYFDSIVEVIDLSSQTVVARSRFDEYITCFTQDGRLGLYSQDAAGVPLIRIWSVTTPDQRR